MFRLYHVIRPEDVDRFDELVYNREEHSAIKRKAIAEDGNKYKHLFKQESSESAGSFECPSTNDTGSSFEPLAPLPTPGLRMRGDSVAVGGPVAAPEYGTHLDDLSPPLNDGRHYRHLDLHDSSIQRDNR